jgi:YHS domain-containing protein
MKKASLALAAIVLIAAATTSALFPKTALTAEASAPQTLCPVMGFAINPVIFSDFDGKRIYFCCSACPAEFKKNPAAFMEQLREKGIALEDAPA